MSISLIRIALETHLNTISPLIQTAYENVPFTPVTGVPYQQVFLLPATPANPTMGDGYYREQGIFQVTLMYPLQAGPKTAADKAEAIRTAFKRGLTLTSWSVNVTIDRTPEIGEGRVDGDRWSVPIKIRWFANIFA
jgi:hypothetical protein